LDTVDDHTRRLLTEAMDEIRAALHAEESSELESASLADRLGQVAQAFEESHPTLAGILSRLLDGLGQMGI
jgi:signal transduction histidine kinase